MSQSKLDYRVLDNGMAVDDLSLAYLEQDEDWKPNGCGSDWLSHIGCSVLQWMLGFAPGMLDEVWKWHDLGYSIHPDNKSAAHKLLVDSLAHHNCMISLRDKSHWVRHFFGGLIHIVLIYGGNKAYWQGVGEHDYERDRFVK